MPREEGRKEAPNDVVILALDSATELSYITQSGEAFLLLPFPLICRLFKRHVRF